MSTYILNSNVLAVRHATHSKVNSRMLDGVFIMPSEHHKLTVMATDGHMLAHIETDLPFEGPTLKLELDQVKLLWSQVKKGDLVLDFPVPGGPANVVCGDVALQVEPAVSPPPDYWRVMPRKQRKPSYEKMTLPQKRLHDSEYYEPVDFVINLDLVVRAQKIVKDALSQTKCNVNGMKHSVFDPSSPIKLEFTENMQESDHLKGSLLKTLTIAIMPMRP